jgi:6-phosphogluconolactonase
MRGDVSPRGAGKPAAGSLVQRVDDASALHEAGAAKFASAAVQAIDARSVFRVALAGGSTPKGVYARLAEDVRWRSQVQWGKIQFFWGDERHVGPDHPDSNYRMAREAMLDRLPIDPAHVWRMKGEYEDAARAADEYQRDLRSVFALSDGQCPRFDLILLGMGADGHTASLFPGTDALRERRRLAVANHVEKLATDRMTLTVPVFNHGIDVLFLVQGPDKAEALKAVLEGPYDPERLPAQLIQPASGRLTWLVDSAAARLLSKDSPKAHSPEP